MNSAMTEITKVKFINFGTITKLDKATTINLPEQIDHIPPEVLNGFLEAGVFSPHQQNFENHSQGNQDMNI